VKPVVFHPDAGQEARDARDYYEALREGLGDDFKGEVDAALARIQKNPELHGAVLRAIRNCLLHRFPYSIYYEELDDQIWIAAVAHHSRRPKYWSKRRP
jgi:plasmid stabilization system protein ParE